ncbi:NADH-ubiquinone/plastoquinone oxidoreductase chain 6 [mine drainage metagenome]|uniref:NADH-ubiquinone/plastoquinone oxidoreductase chain 6 n=1 Tax=mine drainage metagenome TaxID=410659 RepID=T1A8T4_9ZZZZ
MTPAEWIEEGVFWVFGAILVVSAFRVITVRHPVHAALFLVLCFFNTAILWILAGAEFLGIILILIYVGAVLVLLLFVVMMLDVEIEKLREGFVRYAPLGAIVALILVLELVYVFWAHTLGFHGLATPVSTLATHDNTRALGTELYRRDLYPFELAGMILLVGLIAAILLTLRHRPGIQHQNPAGQVRVRARDRVRLVSLKPPRRGAPP